MTFLAQLALLERMDGFIHRKRTGTAKQLGKKLGISRTTVFHHFENLSAMGAEIEFCAEQHSYIYVGDKKPHFPGLVK